jgi:hypothetical protein
MRRILQEQEVGACMPCMAYAPCMAMRRVHCMHAMHVHVTSA